MPDAPPLTGIAYRYEIAADANRPHPLAYNLYGRVSSFRGFTMNMISPKNYSLATDKTPQQAMCMATNIGDAQVTESWEGDTSPPGSRYFVQLTRDMLRTYGEFSPDIALDAVLGHVPG